jgi:hypothetical protein
MVGSFRKSHSQDCEGQTSDGEVRDLLSKEVMTRMETMTDALDRLRSEGFLDHFRVDEGTVTALKAGRSFRPEELVIARELRFEGASNPADESILLALKSEDGAVKGTLCAAYGPEAPAAEAAVLQALAERRGDLSRS